MKKVCIIGLGRGGKDTMAETLNGKFGVSFRSSSEAAAEAVCFPALKDKYGYTTWEECFNDRHSHRSEWYNLITEYNMEDPSKLAKEILKDNDIYVGMRNKRELQSCIDHGIFDIVIWVDAEERLGVTEDSSSITVTKDMADIIITNNGTLQEFENKVSKLWEMFK